MLVVRQQFIVWMQSVEKMCVILKMSVIGMEKRKRRITGDSGHVEQDCEIACPR